jgi:hypothetical protein
MRRPRRITQSLHCEDCRPANLDSPSRGARLVGLETFWRLDARLTKARYWLPDMTKSDRNSLPINRPRLAVVARSHITYYFVRCPLVWHHCSFKVATSIVLPSILPLTLTFRLSLFFEAFNALDACSFPAASKTRNLLSAVKTP